MADELDDSPVAVDFQDLVPRAFLVLVKAVKKFDCVADLQHLLLHEIKINPISNAVKRLIAWHYNGTKKYYST